MKTYIGISRDHSGSMGHLVKAAANDYNQVIDGIKQAAAGDDSIVSVVKCGVGYKATVDVEVLNSSVTALKPLVSYVADGNRTPLYDSVGKLIEILSAAPDASNPEVTFLVMVITDGLENSSVSWSASRLKANIQALQGTDRWTFVFRVPVGSGSHLARELGLHEGNILEWAQTDREMRVSTEVTRSSLSAFYSNVRSGVRSTDKFYTNLATVRPREVRAKLTDISAEIKIWKVAGSSWQIKPFVEHKNRGKFAKGAAFYELVKPEKAVQSHKVIAIQNKKTGEVYAGAAARDLLGLPHTGTVRVSPGDHGKFNIFIQSTSVNRNLPEGSTVLYWKDVA